MKTTFHSVESYSVNFPDARPLRWPQHSYNNTFFRVANRIPSIPAQGEGYVAMTNTPDVHVFAPLRLPFGMSL